MTLDNLARYAAAGCTLLLIAMTAAIIIATGYVGEGIERCVPQRSAR